MLLNAHTPEVLVIMGASILFYRFDLFLSPLVIHRLTSAFFKNII